MDYYGGFRDGLNDLTTAFRQYRAIAVVGSFTQVRLDRPGPGDQSQRPPPVYQNVSRNVALWDYKTWSWQSLGEGIPSVPSRIVSDGSQLVALSGQTLWRWNGTSQIWVAHELTLTSIHGEPSISDLAFGGNKLFVVGNFDKVNGVVVKNVSMITFTPKDTISVVGIGLGLPGVQPQTVFGRSATQIFIGGTVKGTRRVVYEWRQGRKVPWGRIGPIGVENSGPVKGVAVVNVRS